MEMLKKTPFWILPTIVLSLAAVRVQGAPANITQQIREARRLVAMGRAFDEGEAAAKSILKNTRQLTRTQKTACYEIIMKAQLKKGELDKCEATYRELMGIKPNPKTTEFSFVRLLLGEMFVTRKQYAEALEEFRKVPLGSKRGALGDPSKEFWMLTHIARCLRELGKSEEAVEAMSKAFKSCPEAQDWTLVKAHELMMDLCRDTGDTSGFIIASLKRVVRMWQRFEKNDDAPGKERKIKELRGNILPLMEKSGNAALAVEAVEEIDRLIPIGILSPDLCEQLQLLKVEILKASAHWERALFEAKILCQVCSGEMMPEAVDCLVNIFKARDHNVIRANAYLVYINSDRRGPDEKLGTEDDPANPLHDISPPPNYSEREECYLEILSKLPQTWRGRTGAALLYRYLDQPQAALAELDAAFAMCPMEREPIERITDGIGQLLVQLSGDPQIADRFAAFQRFGARGPDGIRDTADDLEDPVQEFLPGDRAFE